MSDIDAVRDRLDIVEVVGGHVQLKRTGRTYKGLCPFHDEKTPSFVVFPDSGNWRCFGACAIGGDAFDFVMRIENLDFRSALEQMALRVGIDLTPPSPEKIKTQDRQERMRAATAAASLFYHQQLLRSNAAEAAREYLRNRDFGIEVAQNFGLGWAPDEWSALTKHLVSAGYDEDELLAAGLVRSRESGGVYDAFRGRLIIPIHDPRGRAVGFGARSLDPKGQPKYINSPQSEIFDKSHLLYGLHRAARAMRAQDKAVIVEGYTDVIRAHAAGFENVVASLGTALTEPHLRLLKRYTHTIVLALDSDAAGQAATLRGLEVAREATAGDVVPVPTGRGKVSYEHRVDVNLRVAMLPAGQDPDDVIRERPDLWRKRIHDAPSVMDYLFQTLTKDLKLEEPDGKTVAADRLLPVVASVTDPVSRAAWLGRLAQMIQIDERSLSMRLSEIKPKKPRPAAPAKDRQAGLEVPKARPKPRRQAQPRSESGQQPAGFSGGAAPPAASSSASGSATSSDEPPDWAIDHVPEGAMPAGMPEDEMPPDWALSGSSDHPDQEPQTSVAGRSNAQAGSEGRQPNRQDGTASSRSGAQNGSDSAPGPMPNAPRRAPSQDPVAGWLIGQLLVDLGRLEALDSMLAEAEQAALHPDDLPSPIDRDLLAALAAQRAPNGEAGTPHFEEPLDGYASQLRRRVADAPPTQEDDLLEEMLRCVLRLRKRELERALPGLRFLLSEAPADERKGYLSKVLELSGRINALTQLISPPDVRASGKKDTAAFRQS
jgi:DNA primase